MSPNLYNNFLNWDDTAYVVNNDLIKTLSLESIKTIFTTPEVISTYAPITLISWALDYAVDGLNPFVFHTTNLILHLLIVSLVFYLTQLISKNKGIALVTALLFGIHPMHVEVVGWVSARKDLVYTLFFLLALIAYWYYTEKKAKYPKYYFYIICVLFFIMSLLAKGAAVILPLILCALDYLRHRKLTLNLVLEKVPFFLLSVFFTILSIQMQAKGGAMEDRQFTTVIDSLSVGFYGYLNYLVKSIIPFNLSAYHPYTNALGQSNPWYYYASALPVLLLFFWLLTKIKTYKHVVFGFAFFFITLIPVIQVLPFGTAVTADRYTYLSYFGLFFLIGLGLNKLYLNFKHLNKVLLSSILVYVIGIGFISFNYSKTFKNGETLWTNVIEHYPNNFLGYMNRADHRSSKNEKTEALNDLKLALELNPNYTGLYFSRAFIYAQLNKYNLAFADLNSAVEKDPTYMVAYLNRGLLYGETNNIDAAIKDFTKVIQLAPKDYFGYFNRATYYLKKGNYVAAITDLNEIIELNQFLDETYYLRGKIYLLKNDVNNAFKDFTKTLKINSSFARAHTQRGHLWFNKNNIEKALFDYQQATTLDQNQIDALINLGLIYMNTQAYNKAENYFEKAKQVNPNNFLVYYNTGLLYQLTNKYDAAILAFDKALQLNPKYVPAKQARLKTEALLNGDK